MTDGHCFISYSSADSLEFARRLVNELEGGGDEFIKTWFDKRDIDPARDWDDQIVEGIRTCKCMLFIMTKDSTAQGSTCKNEWAWALRFKKPVVPIRLQEDVEQPFGLGNRQWIDFTGEFRHGLAKLRMFLHRMDSPEGQLDTLRDRLADAQRDLRRAKDEDQPRIKAEIAELIEQIKRQEEIVKNPKAAEKKTGRKIHGGLERERQPETTLMATATARFINPPPGIAPSYYQDRDLEQAEIIRFLNDDSQRLMTIVGRLGVGKTALVCRLLRGLESGELPDNLGKMRVDGIVYLSETGSHRVNFANVFADLSRILPEETSALLKGVYKNPRTPTSDKMRALLDAFPVGRVVLLLDSFESLVDPENLNLRDDELHEALDVLLCGQHQAVKAIITTRIAPRDLALCEPGRQHVLSLDDGLTSPYAENVLREMDADGHVGLKVAPDALLKQAREKTRGYPRALEALYAILSTDRYTTLKELLEIRLPDEVVQKLVGEAFSRLDPSAQEVMQALAVYGRPVSPAAVDYVLQPHLPSVDSALVLNRLVNMHFARREAGQYYLHPADRDYILHTVPLTPIPPPETEGRREGFTRHNLLGRAADYFAKARKPRNEWKGLNDLSAQLAEFELRCAAGNYDAATRMLIEIDREYLFVWGHYRLIIEMHEKLQGRIDDLRLAGASVGTLGTAYDAIGEVRRAIEYEEKALQVARGVRDRQAESVWLGSLGSAYADLGDAHKAIEFDEQALVIHREIGDRRNEGVTLANLANRYADLGDAHKAIEFYEQALVIHRESHDRGGEGSSLGNLGNRYAELGDWHKAIDFCEQALGIAREIGSRGGEASALGGLGNHYAELGDVHKAIDFCEQALGIAREIGDRRNEGAAVGNLGNRYAELGDWHKAMQFHEQALGIAREIGDRRTEGNTLCNLGTVYANLGDTHKAIEFCEQALTIAREIDDRRHEGITLGNLGFVYANLGDEYKALEFYGKALAIAREIGDRRHESVELVNMAEARLVAGDWAESERDLKQATLIANEISSPSAQASASWGLAQIYLMQNSLDNARTAIEVALRYDEPQHNHNATVLHGIIALRQSERETAKQAFAKSVGQADGILSKTPDYFGALDARGLALCGLALTGTLEGHSERKRDGEDRSGLVQQAIETFRAARKVTSAAGVVKRVLRLFDELVKCNQEGVLAEIRKSAEGNE